MPLPNQWKEKSTDEIMKTAGPQKTSHLYDIAWEKFQEFLGNTDQPGEDDYLKYFNYLHEAREFKSSTLWNTYAKLNSVHQRKYGSRLQLWPRLKVLLKRYQQGYERKTASIFTQDQIIAALRLNYSTPKWVMWKAAVATAYCGGLRGFEVRSMKISDVTVDQQGVWMTYYQAKQKGEVKKNRLLVPFGEPISFGSYVCTYLELLRESLPDHAEDGPLFMRPSKSGLTRQPMGANQLGEIGKNLAMELGLPKPWTFTGHCFRRSAATAAANQGATSVMMKGQFGWVQEQTALLYIDATKERPLKMAELLTGVKVLPEKPVTVRSVHPHQETVAVAQPERSVAAVDITKEPEVPPVQGVSSGPVSDASITSLAANFTSALTLVSAGNVDSVLSSSMRNLSLAVGALGALNMPATVTVTSPSGEKILVNVNGAHFNLSNH